MFVFLFAHKIFIQGSRIEFVDHVSASYRWCAGILYWVTFWARDLASSNPEPKLYQANVRLCGQTFCEIYIFRLKPTDEGIFMKPLFQSIYCSQPSMDSFSFLGILVSSENLRFLLAEV